MLAQDQQKPTGQNTKVEAGEPPPPPVLTPKPSPVPLGQASPSPTPSAPQAKKPLSEKENPEMIGKRNINKGIIKGGSIEKEIAFGNAVAAEVEKQAKILPLGKEPGAEKYAELYEWINRVVQNLVLHSDSKIPFTVKIIDSDEVNAFALPGGHLYVNRGLIVIAGDESELAGVMAHEISHVSCRHGMEQMKKAQIAGIAANAASILLGGGIGGAVLQNTAGIGLAGLFMKFSRDAEEEADFYGAQYLYAAGYDPAGLNRMFEKLEVLNKNKKKPGFLQKVFADHPAPAARRAKISELISRFPERDEYVVSSSDFQRNHDKLIKLTAVAINGTGDPDQSNTPGANSKPTLKRRQQTDPDTPDGETPPSEDRKPPTMKKTPGSTPTPTPDKP